MLRLMRIRPPHGNPLHDSFSLVVSAGSRSMRTPSLLALMALVGLLLIQLVSWVIA